MSWSTEVCPVPIGYFSDIHMQPTHLDTKLQSKQCSKMSCHIEWQCDECFMLIFQLLHFHLWCDFVTIHISVFIYWHISGWVENCSVQAVSSVTHFLKEKKIIQNVIFLSVLLSSMCTLNSVHEVHSVVKLINSCPVSLQCNFHFSVYAVSTPPSPLLKHYILEMWDL